VRRGGAALVENVWTAAEASAATHAVVGRPRGLLAGYIGGANPRSMRTDNTFDVGAPRSATLLQHQELQYLNTSVRGLGLWCPRAEPGAVPTLLSSTRNASLRVEPTDMGRRLAREGVMYTRWLPTATSPAPIYSTWQATFGTDCRHTAAGIASALGLRCAWQSCGGVLTVARCSAFERDPADGAQLLFTSMADSASWFDSWPGLAHLHAAHSQEELATGTFRPLQMFYGAGTPLSPDDASCLTDAHQRETLPVDWRSGLLLLIDNHRTGHGRGSCSSDLARELRVVLGATFKRSPPPILPSEVHEKN